MQWVENLIVIAQVVAEVVGSIQAPEQWVRDLAL